MSEVAMTSVGADMGAEAAKSAGEETVKVRPENTRDAAPRLRRINRIAVWSVIILVALLALGIFVGSIMEYNSLQKERQSLEREIELAEQNIARYQHDIDAPMDDEYIERVAKDKLNLINPDEIIVHSDN